MFANGKVCFLEDALWRLETRAGRPGVGRNVRDEVHRTAASILQEAPQPSQYSFLDHRRLHRDGLIESRELHPRVHFITRICATLKGIWLSVVNPQSVVTKNAP